MKNRIDAWHFIPRRGELFHPERWKNPVVRAGVTYSHKGKVELCQRGLHASRDAIHALRYAPGPIVCRVECWDRVVEGPDKLVCGKRRVMWMADATDALAVFAKWCSNEAKNAYERDLSSHATAVGSARAAYMAAVAAGLDDADEYASQYNDASARYNAALYRAAYGPEEYARSYAFAAGAPEQTKKTIEKQNGKLTEMLLELGPK